MKPIPLLQLVALVLAPTAAVAAEPTFVFDPMLPRPVDEVTLSVTYDTACFQHGEVQRNGRRVRVTAVEGCICPEVLPSPLTFEVELGALPLAVYDVELWLARREPDVACGEDQLLASTRLVVQSISTHLTIATEPASPQAGQPVTLHVESFCPPQFRGTQIVGDLIQIEEIPSAILAPCGPHWENDFELGPLDAGRYSLLFLFDESGDPFGADGPYAPPLLNTVDTLVVSAAPQPPQGETELLLEDGRFRITAVFGPEQELAQAVALTARSGYFWFFSPDNVELVVKVLDGCAFNAHYWVFAAGLTDVDVEIEVEDRLTGTMRSYHSPQGGFEEVRDALAFSGCALP